MRIAVFIPCYNEELTVGKVVRDFRKALPDAEIYVFDNNSRDETSAKARDAGAIVIRSPRQGKGHVVRHAFRILDADAYVMVDGDDTYPAEEVARVLDPVLRGEADMVVGTRLGEHQPGSFRRFHLFGNHFLSGMVSSLFGQRVSDMLSGYRAFSRDFAMSVPLNSRGFEIETDLTLQAISKGYTVVEVPCSYRNRPEGSFSKLKTFGDGYLILRFIARLMKDHRPLPFFSGAAFACLAMSFVAGWAPIQDYWNFSYVYTVPRAVLAASLGVLSAVLFGVGLILDSQIRTFNEHFMIMRRSIQLQNQQHQTQQDQSKRRAG